MLLVFGLIAAGAVTSIGTVIASNILYTKLGTYHETKWLTGNEKQGTEPTYEKLGKLCVYNFIIAISITGLVFVYTTFPVGGADLVGIAEGKALIAAAIVMHFSIRVASLSEKTSDKLYDRALSFGYSFVLSIYFLSFFAVGAYLVRNGFTTQQIMIPRIGEQHLSDFLLLLIAGPGLSVFASETILLITGVNKDNKDNYA